MTICFLIMSEKAIMVPLGSLHRKYSAAQRKTSVNVRVAYGACNKQTQDRRRITEILTG